jgi:hypothetical protein
MTKVPKVLKVYEDIGLNFRYFNLLILRDKKEITLALKGLNKN